jgi:hypothetical protein
MLLPYAAYRAMDGRVVASEEGSRQLPAVTVYLASLFGRPGERNRAQPSSLNVGFDGALAVGAPLAGQARSLLSSLVLPTQALAQYGHDRIDRRRDHDGDACDPERSEDRRSSIGGSRRDNYVDHDRNQRSWNKDAH